MQVDPVIYLFAAGQYCYEQKIINLFKKTGVFEPFELEWLCEQLDPNESNYHWCVYLQHNEVLGASCFGPIMKERPGRFDLYWIAVDPDHQGKGIGKKLLTRTEEEAKKLSASHMYIETGSFNEGGNKLYADCGYKLMGVIEQYYNDDNHKHIWGKKL